MKKILIVTALFFLLRSPWALAQESGIRSFVASPDDLVTSRSSETVMAGSSPSLIDGYTDVTDGEWPGAAGTYRIAQIFTASQSYNLRAIQIKAWLNPSINANQDLLLETVVDGKPSNTILGSATLPYSAFTTASPGSVVEFDFSPSVSLSSGTTYAIVWYSEDNNDTHNFWWRANSTAGDGVNIDAFTNNSPSVWTSFSPSYTNTILYFATFADSRSSGITDSTSGINPTEFILVLLALLFTFMLIPWIGEKAGATSKLFKPLLHGRLRRLSKYV